MDLARELVDGKSVAVVGNSEAIFEKQDGMAIDGHDVVFRINLGLPWKFPGKRMSLGFRTDVWATARYWPMAVPEECKLILWMKLTDLGKIELAQMLESKPKQPVIVWTESLEKKCSEFVGASPSTGMRLCWWLKRGARPANISLYGFDHWKRKCHWANTVFHWDHKPHMEASAMRELGLPC